MAGWRRCDSGEGKLTFRWLRARGRLPEDASWRGEDAGVDGVDGGGVLRWGVELAAMFSGEVRGAAVLLYKTSGKCVTEVRTRDRRSMEQEGEAGIDGTDRIRQETVAEWAAPACDSGGLVAETGWASWGKRRGARGGYIGARTEGDHRHYGRN